jgi:hypothetical protein
MGYFRVTALIAPLLCFTYVYAAAQGVPPQVNVGGTVYSVQGPSLTDQNGKQALDVFTIRKAAFTASILDKQILHSEFNRQLFDAPNRAAVFADEGSERLIEPWFRPLSDGADDKALGVAKDRFKTWVANLASNPGAAMLSIAHRDYQAGMNAYRDNAEIYRRVTKQNETLTYDEALEFLQNQRAIARLLTARALEVQLTDAARPSDILLADDGALTRFSKRVQMEVANKVDVIKTVSDLEKSDDAIRKIALSEIPSLKKYDQAIKPSVIRFNVSNFKNGAATQPSSSHAGSVTTGFAGENIVAITVPMPELKEGQRVDITGGILPAPYPINRQSPIPGNRATVSTSPAQSGSAVRLGNGAVGQTGIAGGGGASSGNNSPGGDDLGSGIASQDSPPNPTTADQSASNSDITGVDTPYSPKPYHSSDGWVFNQANGLWQNPDDPGETRIPSVITCCDETGLAFPNEAVEAQQAFWGNGSGGGTDPNCGRLYSCGGSGGDIAPPGNTADAGSIPTDKDDEILKVLDYLDHLPADVRGPVTGRFLRSLKGPYHDRAVYLSYHRPVPAAALNAAPHTASAIKSNFSANQLFRSPGNASTITGLGGGVTSSYQPITPSEASNIVGRYKSIPGGVTLEGAGNGLPLIKTVTYFGQANAFIINDDLVYLNPVSAKDFSEIAEALTKDDRLGVSLGKIQIVYGNLRPNSSIAWDLKIADRLLAAIVFNTTRYLVNYKTAPGHVNELSSAGVAVYFNFHEYRFSEDASGELKRVGVDLKTTMVPLIEKQSGNGGLSPDFNKINRADFPESAVTNLKHLQKNIDYYARERIVRRTIAYGEAAAFARFVKANGTKLQTN